MRKKIFAILAPVLAVPLLAGAGFALFQFGGASSASAVIEGGNVRLEAIADLGEASIVNGSGEAGAPDVPSLVFSYYSIGFSDDVLIQYLPGTNWEEREMEIDLLVTLDVNKAPNMLSYARIGSGWEQDGDSVYRLTVEGAFSAASGNAVSYVFGDWPPLDYRTGMRPTNVASYQAMREALEGESLSFSFYFSLGGSN